MNLIAHRCNNDGGFYENSLFACKNCLLKDYIDGIEVDVRLSRDNVLVISHDNLVKTNKGKIFNINKTKYNSLKKYNIGDSNNIVRIISLESFLNSINTSKKIIIEIKDDDFKVVDILYNVISKYDLNFYVCSFHYDVVDLLKNKYPNVRVGLIIGYMFNLDKIHNKFDFNLLHYNLVNRINKTKEVFIWTVDNEKIYNRIRKYGNDINIITNKAYMLNDL